MKIDFYDLLPYAGFPKQLCHDLKFLKDKLPIESNNIEKSAYFYGANGIGKTIKAGNILAQSILKRLGGDVEYELQNFDPEHPPQLYQVFCWYPQLLMNIKKTFERTYSGPTESELLTPILETEFLVLDDIGPEKTTDWSYNILYLIIGTRYNEMLPTIFTSNLSLNELAAKLQDTRITSRIVGMCKNRIFDVQGEDRRINIVQK